MSPASDARVVHLAAGETAVIGYGSLLSKVSLERTIGRRYDGPFELCHVEGWRRTWDISMPNAAFYFVDGGERVYPRAILYLNVRPDPSTSVNVVLFVLRNDELQAMHDREWIYTPVNVAEQVRGVRVVGGEAVIYVGRPEHERRNVREPREAAVRASYLRVIEDGLAATTAEYRSEYWRTTDPVPREVVVDDTLDPERSSPWAAAGRNYRPSCPES